MTNPTLHLVRHGQSTWNAAGRWQGQADPPLSDEGRTQARALADHFAGKGLAHVASSDLDRALATATILVEQLDLPLEVDPVLRELDVGNWSGLTRAQIREQDAPALEAYFAGAAGWIDGEDYEAHTARCGLAATLLEARAEEHGTIAAVTHGGTLRGILLHLLELDPSNRRRLAGIGHCAVTTLHRSPNGWRLEAFNVPTSTPLPHH